MPSVFFQIFIMFQKLVAKKKLKKKVNSNESELES